MARKEYDISTGQMRTIYGLSKKAELDNDTLHVLVQRIAAKESIKALTWQEAKRVILELRQLTGEEPETSPRGKATPEQQRLIYSLARQLGWADDPTRLRSWLESRYHASHPRFLQDQDAYKCIEAMKAMLKGGRKERKVK